MKAWTRLWVGCRPPLFFLGLSAVLMLGGTRDGFALTRIMCVGGYPYS